MLFHLWDTSLKKYKQLDVNWYSNFHPALCRTLSLSLSFNILHVMLRLKKKLLRHSQSWFCRENPKVQAKNLFKLQYITFQTIFPILYPTSKNTIVSLLWTYFSLFLTNIFPIFSIGFPYL